MYVPEAEPNTGFMAQLAQYDLELLQINEWKIWKILTVEDGLKSFLKEGKRTKTNKLNICGEDYYSLLL